MNRFDENLVASPRATAVPSRPWEAHAATWTRRVGGGRKRGKRRGKRRAGEGESPARREARAGYLAGRPRSQEAARRCRAASTLAGGTCGSPSPLRVASESQAASRLDACPRRPASKHHACGAHGPGGRIRPVRQAHCAVRATRTQRDLRALLRRAKLRMGKDRLRQRGAFSSREMRGTQLDSVELVHALRGELAGRAPRLPAALPAVPHDPSGRTRRVRKSARVSRPCTPLWQRRTWGPCGRCRDRKSVV